MPDKEYYIWVPGLPSAISLTGSEQIAIVQDGGTVQLSINDLAAYIGSGSTPTTFQQLLKLSGLVDGTNTVFVYSGTPTQFFLNGQLLDNIAAYAQSAGTITLVVPPFVGDILAAFGNV